MVRGSSWLLRNSLSGGPPDLTFNYGLGCDLGFAAPGAISRGRGDKGLPAALRGTDLNTLDTGQNLVALTFDAGANADAVPSILGTLERNCIPATSFLTGDGVDDFPADARRIAVRYPVGNHSYTHPHLPALPDATVRDEVTRAERTIQGSTKFNTRPMFRLMHVGSHPTDGSTLDADALPTMIAELKRRGYGFTTVYDSI